MNKKTIEVAGLYEDLLTRRSKSLDAAKRNIDKKVAVARSAYSTIENGGAFVALTNEGLNEYRLLTDFQAPELKTIYDSALIGAFNDVSWKIKNEK